MRVGILNVGEPEDSKPWKFTSVSKAKLYVADGTHERLSKKKIRELAFRATPAPDPDRFMKVRLEILIEDIPSLKDPLSVEPNLNLFYPVKDYSSYAKANFERIWGENCTRLGNPVPF